MPRPRHRIPPLPQFTVLVDRDDGTEWAVSHTMDEDDGYVRVTLNDEALLRGTLPQRVDAIYYPASEGANMGQGIRVFARGGRIGYEVVQYEAWDTPIQTREGVVRESYRFKFPVSRMTPFYNEIAVDLESVI